MDAQPLLTECVVDAATRQAYIGYAAGLGLPVLKLRHEHGGTVAICGSGPSLRTQLDVLRAWPGEVWAINNALNYLIDEGVCVTGFVALDPQDDIADCVAKRHPNVKYYISSVCHPKVFQMLTGLDVMVWHALQHDCQNPPGELQVSGGMFTSHRAPVVAYVRGFRDIHIFGCDASFDRGSYAWEDAEGDGSLCGYTDVITVRAGGKLFRTSPILMHQAAFFARMADTFPCPLHFHGEGLTQTFVAAPIHQLQTEGAEAA